MALVEIQAGKREIHSGNGTELTLGQLLAEYDPEKVADFLTLVGEQGQSKRGLASLEDLCEAERHDVPLSELLQPEVYLWLKGLMYREVARLTEEEWRAVGSGVWGETQELVEKQTRIEVAAEAGWLPSRNGQKNGRAREVGKKLNRKPGRKQLRRVWGEESEDWGEPDEVYQETEFTGWVDGKVRTKLDSSLEGAPIEMNLVGYFLTDFRQSTLMKNMSRFEEVKMALRYQHGLAYGKYSRLLQEIETCEFGLEKGSDPEMKQRWEKAMQRRDWLRQEYPLIDRWDPARVLELGEVAQRELILRNVRLVITEAKKYQGRGLPLPDLIQEGTLGLMRAVSGFDPSRGVRLSTYATWWIRQKIARACGDMGRTIRIPINQGQRWGRIRRVAERLQQISGEEPSCEEIAAEMGLTPEQVKTTLLAAREPLDLDELVGDEENRPRLDLVADSEAELPHLNGDIIFRDRIVGLLRYLPMREAWVVAQRVGLIDGESRSMEQIAKEMGYCRERVRLLEGQALAKLRVMIDLDGNKLGKQEWEWEEFCLAQVRKDVKEMKPVSGNGESQGSKTKQGKKY